MKVIINEQHSLNAEQKEILKKEGDYELVKIPASGLSKAEIFELGDELDGQYVVFVSPIPLLIAYLARRSDVSIFHNDKRVKKELPNGKVISVVAEEGWELVDM